MQEAFSFSVARPKEFKRRIVAHLSDGSAVDFVDSSVVNSSGVTTLGVYTLSYRAASAGQTITVTFTNQAGASGNVTLQAATLQ